MLRQKPTQISLGRSDILWHTENLDRRKAERASKNQAQTEATDVPATQPLVQGQTTVLPYHGPKPPSTAKPNIKEKPADDSLVSREPVPHDSPAYWQSLVASVVGRPQADCEPNTDSEPDDSDHTSTHNDGIENTYVDIDDYERSHSASIATDQGSEKQDNPEIPNQLEDNIHPSSLKRHAFPFKYHLRSLKRSKRRWNLHDPHSEGLDGASERLPTQSEDWDHYVESDYQGAMQYYARCASECNTSGHSTSDIGLVHVSDSSVSSHSTSDMGLNMYTTDHDGYLSNRFDQESTANLISGHQSMDQLQCGSSGPGAVDLSQRASSGLPRSSLYISQSAISSSPEKSLITPANTLVEEGLGLPSQPPRRRIKYRPRADTYSYEESEISNGAKQYQHFSPTIGINELNASLQSISLHSETPEAYRSYSFDTQSTRQASDDYSTTSSMSTPSPNRNPQGRYRIRRRLPPPFSETPRTVSQNDVIPASSSRNPSLTPTYSPSAGISTPSSPTLPQSSRQYTAPPNPTSPGDVRPPRSCVYKTSPYGPKSMPGNLSALPSRPAEANSSSPMAPRTPPRILPVYNDSLPTASQPQTPYQLPRHGVPIPNTYYTAPPRVSSFQTSYQRPSPVVHPVARGPEIRLESMEVPQHMRRSQRWVSAQDPTVDRIAIHAEQDLTTTQNQRPTPAQTGTGRRRNSPFWRSRRGQGFWEGQENTGSVGNDVRGDVQEEEERESGDGPNRLEWLG